MNKVEGYIWAYVVEAFVGGEINLIRFAVRPEQVFLTLQITTSDSESFIDSWTLCQILGLHVWQMKQLQKSFGASRSASQLESYFAH